MPLSCCWYDMNAASTSYEEGRRAGLLAWRGDYSLHLPGERVQEHYCGSLSELARDQGLDCRIKRHGCGFGKSQEPGQLRKDARAPREARHTRICQGRLRRSADPIAPGESRYHSLHESAGLRRVPTVRDLPGQPAYMVSRRSRRTGQDFGCRIRKAALPGRGLSGNCQECRSADLGPGH
jgi:hypothetical protein